MTEQEMDDAQVWHDNNYDADMEYEAWCESQHLDAIAQGFANAKLMHLNSAALELAELAKDYDPETAYGLSLEVERLIRDIGLGDVEPEDPLYGLWYPNLKSGDDGLPF